MSWAEIGTKMRTRRSPQGMSGESVGRLARADAPIIKPPTWEFQRDLERAMGLPEGYLNGEVPLPSGPRLAKRPAGAAQTPTDRRQDANEVRARVEEQLAVFERQNAGVEPAQVRLWLDLVTRALTPDNARAPAANDGLTEAERTHLEAWRQTQQESQKLVHTNQRPGRKRKRSNGE